MVATLSPVIPPPIGARTRAGAEYTARVNGPAAFAQNYDPLGAWPLSTAVALLPVLTLFFTLLVLRKAVWLSALLGLLAALGLAATVFAMPPAMALAAAAHGMVFGLLRIGWIVVASMFLYRLACETGQFEAMKRSIAGLSSDRRIQIILIAFCFGAFLEGTGGGGAPVAIAGAFLIGLGFPPFQAATLCLVANTAPVAWGAVGSPIRVLAGVSGLPELTLSVMTGRILAPFSAILPLWLVRSMVPWRETLAVWPAIAVAGLSFAGMQFYWSNFQGTGLVDVVASIFSLLCMVAFLKFWRPPGAAAPASAAPSPPTRGGFVVLRAWAPFVLASLFIFMTGLPALKQFLVFPGLSVPVPFLHGEVIRMPPVVKLPEAEPALADLNLLALPGTAVLAAALLSGLLSGFSLARIAGIFVATVRALAPSLLAIVCMVGLAYATKYAGMDTVLGLSLTRTGVLYPFFGTLLGWLGVALTGTDAGSNALFGNLQRVTAEQLGLSAILMASANSAGGVMGKMIDAQSIVVASTATGLVGQEAAIFKAVLKHSLLLAVLVGALVTLYAFVLPGWVPAGG